MKIAIVYHRCGTEIHIPYVHSMDVFLNPAFCHNCAVKFAVSGARLIDDPTDTSIEDFKKNGFKDPSHAK